MSATNQTPIRVAIFDDNHERLQSLKFLIEMQSDLLCVGTFPDANSALKNVESSKPDIILMDIEMPGTTGIEAVKIIKEEHPKITIIMQTVFEDETRIFEAIKSGASGYILKKTNPDKILESIRDASEGGSPMTPAIATKVLNYFREKPKLNMNDYELTGREKEILSLLTNGLSYKMIAAEIDVSYHTVNAHLRNIYGKLHVNSLGEAVAKAIKERLV